MAKDIELQGPSLNEEWLKANFWFSLGHSPIRAGFSQGGAMGLYNSGLRRNIDAWNETSLHFFSGLQATARFGLLR